MYRLRLAAVMVAAPALALVSGCMTGDASPVETAISNDATPVPVQVRLPARGDLYATYDATAHLDTEGDAAVVARVSGDVVELLVEEGSRVAAGDALARLDGERLRLEMLAAKADLERVQGEYDRYRDLHDRGLVSKAMYDNLAYDLDALRATYELKTLEHGYSTIRAPIDGIVSARHVRPGQNLKLNDPAFRITSTDMLIADMQIPQTELKRIDVGQAATLYVDSLPGRKFAAKIIRLSPTIDARNGTFQATARIDNGSGELAPGMFARFSIAYELHAGVLYIPRSALIEEDEQTAVWVVTGETVERRVIATGIHSRDRIEVLDGLAESDKVVIVGQGSLRDGSRVLARLGTPENYTG